MRMRSERPRHRGAVTKPTIALLTDFGLDDPYVGQMKGVLAGLAPEAVVVDVSHQVRPFDVMQGAFYLAASWRFFPEGSVLVGVVDPGVGTERRLVIGKREGRFFLGPDNGLLALVFGPESGDVSGARAWELTMPPASGARSNTFHGRDILAPAAARLALGADPLRLGRPLDPEALHRPVWAAPEQRGREIAAHVLHVDRFGNCLLNLPESLLPEAGMGRVELLAPLLQPLVPVRTYAQIPEGGVGMLVGSQGYWELAVNQGNAAAVLGLAPGMRIVLECSGTAFPPHIS
ncbi:SAM hydrolase/SAM-dependent halogenase family protein [Desulfonatronum thiodismutans]|uniref:SAM hydrolase/SAM-dependent halogenase family protein n=1 Tax=Desulfonatronum thiodismutans TaxID=159290 RepID=UPI001F222F18|nr:SAM-dependent chlorinase/fluorinase [Desulfonatronum thiodismutans]